MTEDPDYLTVAKAHYEQKKDEFRIFIGLQGDYGKWLAATISLLHGSALYALGSGKIPNASPSAYLPFLVGLVLMLISALATWTNFTLLAADSLRQVAPRMLVERGGFPTDDSRVRWWTNFTIYAALATGILSVVAFIIGVIIVARCA